MIEGAEVMGEQWTEYVVHWVDQWGHKYEESLGQYKMPIDAWGAYLHWRDDHPDVKDSYFIER